MSDTPRTVVQIHIPIRQDEESFQDLFVTRLQEALTISELGVVQSAERHLDEDEGEPLGATITLHLDEDLSAKQIEGFQTLLAQFGAPRGSVMEVHDVSSDARSSHTFGTSRGLAVYLDGVNLDPKIYKKYDLDRAWDAVNNELGESGMAFGYHEGNTETAIYMYGANAEEMLTALAPLLQKHPLFRQARTVTLEENTPWRTS